MSYPTTLDQGNVGSATTMDAMQNVEAEYLSPFGGQQPQQPSYVLGVQASRPPDTMVPTGRVMRARSDELLDQYGYQNGHGPVPGMSQSTPASAPGQNHIQAYHRVQYPSERAEYIQHGFDQSTHFPTPQYLQSQHPAYHIPLVSCPSDQQSAFYATVTDDQGMQQVPPQQTTFTLGSASTPEPGPMPVTIQAPADTTTFPVTNAPSPPSPVNQVRVINTRPRPQCWEHGCNGREFSTISNLLRHQREKAGVAAKYQCPYCDTVFTRATARNGHLEGGKCKAQRQATT